MIEKESRHIIDLLQKAQSALRNKDALNLKELSNHLTHSACSHQDSASITISILIYALSKLVEREDYNKMRDWEKFVKKFNSILDLAVKALINKNEEKYESYIEVARKTLESNSINLKKYIQDVLKKAAINKGSRIYEHGLSLEHTAKLLGITQWELTEYIGQKQEREQVQTIDVKKKSQNSIGVLLMIPKIIFKYSAIHDNTLKFHRETYYNLNKDPETKKSLDNWASKEKIEGYIKKIKPLWEKEEKKILREIAKITKLKWQEPIIKVYMTGNFPPYSEPLTMRPYKNKIDFIDVLTHELIHQIQSQNSKIFKKWINYMMKKYPNEKLKTKSHILLHAVHKKIYLELTGANRLKRNIKRSVKDSYKRAWQIVQEEGYENIIKKFKEVAK